MIPIADASRRSVNFPIITVGLIAANILAFYLELVNGLGFIHRWALVPAEVARGEDYLTLLTAMFMHGGWLHLIFNLLSCGCSVPPSRT